MLAISIANEINGESSLGGSDARKLPTTKNSAPNSLRQPALSMPKRKFESVMNNSAMTDVKAGIAAFLPQVEGVTGETSATPTCYQRIVAVINSMRPRIGRPKRDPVRKPLGACSRSE